MRSIVRVLALGVVLVALTGCVELAVWGGLEVANLAVAVGAPNQPAYKGRTMCALPDKDQDVRVCTDALAAEGWRAVEFRDGEWRPIITDLEAKP